MRIIVLNYRNRHVRLQQSARERFRDSHDCRGVVFRDREEEARLLSQLVEAQIQVVCLCGNRTV